MGCPPPLTQPLFRPFLGSLRSAEVHLLRILCKAHQQDRTVSLDLCESSPNDYRLPSSIDQKAEFPRLNGRHSGLMSWFNAQLSVYSRQYQRLGGACIKPMLRR